jgi:hypothetical protein
VSDLRRLGKRGSYRLGRLGAPPAAPYAPSPNYPSFAPRHRGPGVLWLLGALAAAGVVAVAALAGWWFLPFLVGLAVGLADRWARWRWRVTLPSVAVITGAGWAGALGWLVARGLPEWAVAHEIAALAGLPVHASIVIAVTVLVAMIEGLAGLWLGRALLPGHVSVR